MLGIVNVRDGFVQHDDIVNDVLYSVAVPVFGSIVFGVIVTGRGRGKQLRGGVVAGVVGVGGGGGVVRGVVGGPGAGRRGRVVLRFSLCLLGAVVAPSSPAATDAADNPGECVVIRGQGAGGQRGRSLVPVGRNLALGGAVGGRIANQRRGALRVLRPAAVQQGVGLVTVQNVFLEDGLLGERATGNVAGYSTAGQGGFTGSFACNMEP